MSPERAALDVVKRWTVGTGGFIAEATLAVPPEEAEKHARTGVGLVFLTDVYTHPLRRGRGWGDRVVKAALAYADKKSWDVWLYVQPHGPSKTTDGRKFSKLTYDQLRSFYSKRGFVNLPDGTMVRRCSKKR